MAAALTSGRRCFSYAAVFLVDHATEMLDDGDWQAAEHALMSFCQELVRLLRPEARLYRWSGTSIVVLLEPHSTPETVRQELERLPVAALRQVIPLLSWPGKEHLDRAIDLFVAETIASAPGPGD